MSEELQTVAKEIEELCISGNLEAAYKGLQQALESYPDAEILKAIQAELLLDREGYQEVLEQTEELLDKIEDSVVLGRMYNARGQALYYLEELDKARVEQNKAVHLLPDSYDAVIGRALIHEELNYLNAAMLDLRRAAALDEEEGQPYAIQASILMRWGRMEQCEEALSEAVKRDKSDLDSRLDLSRIYALKQRSSDAIELLTEIIDSGEEPEEDPDLFAPALLLRAQLSLMLNSTDAALEDARRAQEIIPDQPWAYLQIAATKIHAQIDPEEAIAALKEAEKIAGNILDLPDLYQLYAAVYHMLGKEHKVKKYLEEAEGHARLPGYIYGALNPVDNIPINPSRPIDFRRLLDDLFGSASKAPEGYEKGLRDAIQQVMEQLPQIREEGVERVEIQLPQAPGMIGGPRSLLMEIANPGVDVPVADTSTGEPE